MNWPHYGMTQADKGISMKFLRDFLILWLIFSLWNFGLPRLSFSQVGVIDPEITKHPPEMRASLEENIPVTEAKEKPKGWVWWLIGILAVGGVVAIAAAAGGGGGGGGGGSKSNGGTSGSVAVGW